VSEAHRREWDRRQPLPVGVGVDPTREEPREPHVLAESIGDAVDAEPPHLHPQLERAEPPPELL